MNKKLVIGTIIISIIAIAIRIFFFDPKVSSKIHTFMPYIDEYTHVAQFYYDDFLKYDAIALVYSIPTDKNEKIVCFDENYKHEIYPGNDILSDISVIRSAYDLDKHLLNNIAVDEGFVYFCNANGRASYVYSIKGNKPEYINGIEKKRRILAKKITDNWYFVTIPDSYFS